MKPTVERLRAELARAAADVAAGRVRPAAEFIAEVHADAVRRIERRRSAMARAEESTRLPSGR